MQYIFKRHELKYLLEESEKTELEKCIRQHMEIDNYGKSLICSIYFDTKSKKIARRSLEKEVYKEKLRIRSYGLAQGDDYVFLELKKKFEGIVYKRRVRLKLNQAIAFIKEPWESSDLTLLEIAEFVKNYQELVPSVLITYSRVAYRDVFDSGFRLTFDENILNRDYDLNFYDGVYGQSQLRSKQYLLEVKVAGAIPLWFVQAIAKLNIYNQSFSKYRNAYQSNYKKYLLDIFRKEDNYVRSFI